VNDVPAGLILDVALVILFGADKKVGMDLNRITPPRERRRS
jgi:hypothetical protein